jgi:two-component system, NarL family, sensor histidine kinase DesK
MFRKKYLGVTMRNWYQIIPKSTVLSIYVWIIFCILAFYFIYRSSSLYEILFGIVMILLFFLAYRFSFMAKGPFVYVWVSIEMVISVTMIILMGYIYLALFLAFFIGNIQQKAGFITLYVVHLTTTLGALSFMIFQQPETIMPQFPFITITVIGVILLPFSMYNRMKREILEGQLADANQRISRLMVIEERQRIARDLHDTLGHKLSLIGLKSDLAGKLMKRNPDAALNEIIDIHQTARTALKEVRELVSDMKSFRLKDEIRHIQQILKAKDVRYQVVGSPHLNNTPLLVENVLSMCIREAVTNIVKHSEATFCKIKIEEKENEVSIEVTDNGIGFTNKDDKTAGHGLQGMKERLEFVNGSLEILSNNGMNLTIRVPKVVQQS